MIRRALRTLRYVGAWQTGRARAEEREVRIGRGEDSRPATLVLPASRRNGPAGPSWIVLHGMTRPGRHHAQLRRFVRALSATGAVVVVPEIPEWVRLELDPDATLPAIRGSLRVLRDLPEAAPGRTALVGFSFGAPQAILAAADPSLRGELAGVVAFGGYCGLERTLRFQFTGVHEWRGALYRTRPNPYGRWIVGANFLDGVPGLDNAGAVARALHRLAREAGDQQVDPHDDSIVALARELREGLKRRDRATFDRFVVPPGEEPEPEQVEDLIAGLAAAGRRAHDWLDPARALEGVDRPVHLLHGRDDRLIPFTEAHHIEQRVAGTVRCTVTGLFGHSRRGGRGQSTAALLREGVAFLRALSGVLGAPGGR